jgi:hypothetical protein
MLSFETRSELVGIPCHVNAPGQNEQATTKIAVTVRGMEKLRSCVHALFLEVMAEKADQPCSTFLLPQCGQTIFSFSCSAMVKILENVFLQAWQKNS